MSGRHEHAAIGVTVAAAGVAVAAQDAVAVGADVHAAVHAADLVGVGSVAPVALVATVAGAPVAAFNSQGFTHHGSQLVSQVLIALALVLTLRAVRAPFRARVDAGDVVRAVVAAAYVAAGVKKLLATAGRFILDADALAVDAVKTHLDHLSDHGGVAIAQLDAAMASLPGSVSFLLATPAAARVVFGAGLILELAALLLCARHPVQIVVAGGLIAMHRAIAGLMGLSFPMHELILVIWGLWLPFVHHRRRGSP